MPQRLMKVMQRSEGRNHAQGSSLRMVPARSLRASIALMLLIPQLAGCFHYVPVSNAAVPSGTEVSVIVNDRGRVAFSELLGPGVVRLEGPVLESTDTSMALSVNTIQFLHISGPTTWTGERIEVARDLISEVRERQLSPHRSTLLAGLIVAAAAAVALIGLTGFGGGDPDERPGNGNGEDQ